MKVLIGSLLLVSFCTIVYAEEGLNAFQTNLLKNSKLALQEDDPQKAIEIMARWKGNQHSTQMLIKGHAHYQLEQWQEALAAYKVSLQLDAKNKLAAMPMMECMHRLEQWQALRQQLLQWAPAQSCSLNLLKMSIHCADMLQDRRWQAMLIQTGILRFAENEQLRLQDIELLVEQENWQQAKLAITLALKHVENKSKIWQLLAYVCQQKGEHIESLASYEAALLVDPDNKSLRLAHAQAQFAAGHAGEALKQFKDIMLNEQDHKTIEVAIQCAYSAGETEQAATWMALIPEQKRDDRLHALSLRFDQSLLGKKEFNQRVDDLLAKKVINAHNCLWLGYMAEQEKEFGRAEMLYQLAREQESASKQNKNAAQMASLYLARLWFGQKRASEARNMLEQHLQSYPDDWQARRLLQLMQDE